MKLKKIHKDNNENISSDKYEEQFIQDFPFNMSNNWGGVSPKTS